MEISIKILIIPGVNPKTITDKISLESGAGLPYLLNMINEKYKIDLNQVNNCIMLLDGRRVSVNDDVQIDNQNCREFMVIPMISGG